MVRIHDTADSGLMKGPVRGASDPEIVALEERLRSVGTKAQDIDAHSSGVIRFHAHEPEELHIRRVGPDVAVTALRARLALDVNGSVVRGMYRYTRVWAREGDQSWRVVCGHVSEVASHGSASEDCA